MKALFGVCWSSPMAVADQIKNIYGIKYKVGMFDTSVRYSMAMLKKKYEDINIILVNGGKHLLHSLPFFYEFDGVVVVFDAPLLLQEIKGVTVLDQKFNDDFRYNFKSRELNVHHIVVGLMNKKNVKEIKHVHKNIIHHLIDKSKATSLLDKFNEVIYRITYKKRNDYRALLLKFMYGDISRAVYLHNAQEFLPKRGNGVVSHENLLNFLENEYGQNIIKALKEAKRYKADPPYKEIAKKHNVAKFEINYLDLLRLRGSSVGVVNKV